MSVLEALVGVIAPLDCLACGSEGSSLCRDCSARFIKSFGERCWRCNRLSQGSKTCQSCRHAGGPSHVWIGTTYEDIAQELIRAYKFGHSRVVSQTLARLMVDVYQKNGGGRHDYIVVPVPTATGRARQRGFGHSELLAKTIARKLNLTYQPALRRLGQSRQLGSAREDRLKQLEGKFAVKASMTIAGQSVLLVDDVLTTGGTLIATTKTLRAAGASQVDALLFAKRL